MSIKPGWFILARCVRPNDADPDLDRLRKRATRYRCPAHRGDDLLSSTSRTTNS